MSKRILIISDSMFLQTGYSTVANNIIANIDPSFTVAQLGISHQPVDYDKVTPTISYYSPLLKHNDCCASDVLIEHYDHETKTITHFDPNPNTAIKPITENFCDQGLFNTTDVYAFESAFYVINHFKPDVVIAINDVWGMYKLNHLKNRSKFKLVTYLAVDSECFPIMIKQKNSTVNTMEFISSVDKLVVFTDWAKKTINKSAKLAIDETFNNIEVIEHGVDRTKFFKVPSKHDIITKLFQLDPNEHFIIGSVNRNQPRKRLDAIFQILKILVERYEKSDGKKFMVHFHCAIEDSHGWDLPWLARYYGVQDRIILDKNLKVGQGVPDDLLNLIMNAYDVHLVPTNSEGWGLSILETMSCGVPNVISNYSAHGDWAKNHAVTVDIAAKIHEPITNHIKGIIDVEDAAKKINMLYTKSKIHASFVNKSLELANKLQWQNVCKKWNTLFSEIDISDLHINRYDPIISTQDIIPFPENPIDAEFYLQEIKGR